jgi:hypothetical protein
MNTETERDVMQVCLRGHVITDLLATHPEHGLPHCDRCGAATISQCPTCGDDLPGAAAPSGLPTIGQRSAPQHCPSCGAAFPWSEALVQPTDANSVELLTAVLRRLPAAVRQLRDRHDGRPTVRVVDGYDLEDLLRAILHLHFDEVRRELRTPGYSFGVRTDFIVGHDRIAVACKLVKSDMRERELVLEVQEDIAYYESLDCDHLIVLIHDPEQVLPDPRQFEAAWSQSGGLNARCVVAS